VIGETTAGPGGAAVALRPAGPGDLPFLSALYASTREDELAVVPWSPAEKAAFLRQQFDAQHHHYQTYYASASFDVVLVDGVAAGRVYVHRDAEEVRVIDIALLPAFRNRGIGSWLLRRLQQEAADRCLSIHVERMNPALSLYRRLGFVVAEDKGVYLFMVWRARPDGVPGSAR
jgi:ribosomal protein S18 acetylase RimI-like enzyme